MAVVPQITIDADGAARIGSTRVTLDTFLDAFNNGSEAEVLVLTFPTITLADAYAVIAYYLSHKPAVDRYLDLRREQAENNFERVREDFGKSGLLEKLLTARSTI